MKTRKLLLIVLSTQFILWTALTLLVLNGYQSLAIFIGGIILSAFGGLIVAFFFPEQKMFLKKYEEVLELENEYAKSNRELRDAIVKIGQHEALKLIQSK